MNILDKNDSMADYLRLANLKNLVSTRLRGRADEEFAEMQNPNLSGTAATMPPYIEQQPEFGNYDVRANLKIEPPPFQQGPASQDSKMWSNIAGLKSPDRPLEMPEISAPPLPEALTNIPPSNKPLDAFLGTMGPALKSILGGNTNETPESIPSAMTSTNPGMEEAPKTNLAEPQVSTEPGSIEKVMSIPTLQSKIDEIFGPVDPAMAEAAKSYENAMKAYSDNLDSVTAGLTDQEQKIKERIESRNLSTQDKILMGLALVAPLILNGLIGGKEAVLGSLAGGTKGFADVFTNNAKESKEDQEKLTGLALDKAKIAKEKGGAIALTQEFKTKLKDSIPDKELRNIFMKDGKLINGELVIDSGNPNLPIKASALRDLEDYKRIKKEMPKYASSISATDKALNLIDNLHSLADAGIKSKENKNILQKGASFVSGLLPFDLYDSASGAVKAFFPFTRDMVKDVDGKEYKISALMDTYRTQLADVWRDAKNRNGNAFKATEDHFNKQLPNPTNWDSFLRGESDLNQFKKQLDLVKNNFESVVEYLDEQGFDTSEIQKRIQGYQRSETLNKEQNTRRRQQEATQDALAKSRGA